MDEGEGELRREQPGQGAKPGEDADSARGAAVILVARAGEERGRGELRGAREGGLVNTRGAGAVWSWGATRGRPGGVCADVRRRRGRGAGRREVGETVRGSLVNKPKFQNQFCNFKFFPSSWLQMKKC